MFKHIEPFKIIWKWKNNNQKTQYVVNIFVGNVSDEINAILQKIKNKSLFDALISTSIKDLKLMVSTYGEKWFQFFYNTHHIKHTIDDILTNQIKQSQIIDKHGKEWFNIHIGAILKTNDLIYNYNQMINMQLLRKSHIGDNYDIETYNDDNPEFNLNKNKIDNTQSNTDMKGGATSFNDENDGNDADVSDSNDNQQFDHNTDVIADTNFDTFDMPDLQNISETNMSTMDKDIDSEINNLYIEDEVVINNDEQKTQSMINAFFKNKSHETNQKNMIKFNNDNDNSNKDVELFEVYNKQYVYENYIYKDDTIKMVKTKICCSLLNNSKFQNQLLLPSRLYLWSEYTFENALFRVCLGHKWIYRNNLLNYDVMPDTNLHVYEELYGNMKTVNQYFKSQSNRIFYENDDVDLIQDYEDYIDNNEVYMIDVYNELGADYKTNSVQNEQNMANTFFKLYFPKIKYAEIAHIYNFLKQSDNNESLFINNNFGILLNDLLLDNEVNKVVLDNLDTKYKFDEMYVTQSVIHLRLRNLKGQLNLYKIFDNFKIDDVHIFVKYQLQTKSFFKFNNDGIMTYFGKEISTEVIQKWFTNIITTLHGISFKIKYVIDERIKFIVVNLSSNGRIEYKIQWKESNKITFDKIGHTYNIIRKLLQKINDEQTDFEFAIPVDSEFKFAFINSIQHIVLPQTNKYKIDHNDLSDFCRLFYPFVALIIEPKKRKSDSDIIETSKYGTYLRYKKISKYENVARIEKRILYYLKNYDVDSNTLKMEISKQFNIVENEAAQYINKIKTKYAHIIRNSRKTKKIENAPKYKLSGINIEIQGKSLDNYKIRISGTRNHYQLSKITDLLNVIINLYVEIYIEHNAKKGKLLDKLKQLTNVASRRNKVSYVVVKEAQQDVTKKITKIDKTRLGFVPEEGQNQWSRACQNSGKYVRRPQLLTTAEEVEKQGYVFNKETKMYEKEVTYHGKKHKIYAVHLQDNDQDNDQNNKFYYTCNPQHNGKFMHIGFLSKSRNPHGLCMPCCFIKNQYVTKNAKKKAYFGKCVGNDDGKYDSDVSNLSNKNVNMYILQDSNKLSENKLGMLPYHLDLFMNKLLNQTMNINKLYLESTDGYFLKYGVKQELHRIIDSVSFLLDISSEDIFKKIKKSLNNDDDNILFTYINAGTTRLQYKKRETYASHLLNKDTPISINDVYDLFSYNNVLIPTGVELICFKKQGDETTLINSNLHMPENIKIKPIIFLLFEDSFCYPIVLIKKTEDNISYQKIFVYDKDPIVKHIYDYYNINSKYGSIIDSIMYSSHQLTADITHAILKQNNIKVTEQIVDSMFKCAYLVVNNTNLVTVKRSKIVPMLKINTKDNLKKYIHNIDETIEHLLQLSKNTKNMIDIKPIGLYYSSVKNGTEYTITDIICKNKFDVPIKQIVLSTTVLEKKYKNMILERKPFVDDIEENYMQEDNIYNNRQQMAISQNDFRNEAFQLFRYEFSNFINSHGNKSLRQELLNIIENKELSKTEKEIMLKSIMYYLIDDNLFQIYITNKFGKNNFEFSSKLKLNDGEKIIIVENKQPKLNNYKIENVRKTCSMYGKKNCEKHVQCVYHDDKCKMHLPVNLAIEYVNKTITEMLFDEIKKKSLFHIDNYKILEIINEMHFNTDDTIVSYNTLNLTVLNDLFKKTDELEDDQQNKNLIELPKYFVQEVVNDMYGPLRAYANSFYWLHIKYHKFETRNLGYKSALQNTIVKYLKSLMIEWITLKTNEHEIRNISELAHIKDIDDYIDQWINNNHLVNAMFDFYILSKLYKIPIVFFDENDNNSMTIYDGVVTQSQQQNGGKKMKNKTNSKTNNKTNNKTNSLTSASSTSTNSDSESSIQLDLSNNKFANIHENILVKVEYLNINTFMPKKLHVVYIK
jgi:hypothetical protein